MKHHGPGQEHRDGKQDLHVYIYIVSVEHGGPPLHFLWMVPSVSKSVAISVFRSVPVFFYLKGLPFVDKDTRTKKP